MLTANCVFKELSQKKNKKALEMKVIRYVIAPAKPTFRFFVNVNDAGVTQREYGHGNIQK